MSSVEKASFDIAAYLSKFECSICFESIETAVSLNCAHNMCEPCAKGFFGEMKNGSVAQSKPCPFCAAPITSYVPDHRLRSEAQESKGIFAAAKAFIEQSEKTVATYKAESEKNLAAFKALENEVKEANRSKKTIDKDGQDSGSVVENNDGVSSSSTTTSSSKALENEVKEATRLKKAIDKDGQDSGSVVENKHRTSPLYVRTSPLYVPLSSSTSFLNPATTVQTTANKINRLMGFSTPARIYHVSSEALAKLRS